METRWGLSTLTYTRAMHLIAGGARKRGGRPLLPAQVCAHTHTHTTYTPTEGCERGLRPERALTRDAKGLSGATGS